MTLKLQRRHSTIRVFAQFICMRVGKKLWVSSPE